MFQANPVDLPEPNTQKRIQPRQTPIVQAQTPPTEPTPLDLRPIFNKWSGDKDLISKDGAKKVFEAIQPGASAESISLQVDSLFALCDANTDGEITYDEFVGQYQKKGHQHARHDDAMDDDISFQQRIHIKKERSSETQQDDENVSLMQ